MKGEFIISAIIRASFFTLLRLKFIPMTAEVFFHAVDSMMCFFIHLAVQRLDHHEPPSADVPLASLLLPERVALSGASVFRFSPIDKCRFLVLIRLANGAPPQLQPPVIPLCVQEQTHLAHHEPSAADFLSCFVHQEKHT